MTFRLGSCRPGFAIGAAGTSLKMEDEVAEPQIPGQMTIDDELTQLVKDHDLAHGKIAAERTRALKEELARKREEDLRQLLRERYC